MGDSGDPADKEGTVSQGYRELRYYSMQHDAEVARLSLADDRGQEYYAVIEVANGQRWRERREAALCAVDDAIVRGDEPGEVKYA